MIAFTEPSFESPHWGLRCAAQSCRGAARYNTSVKITEERITPPTPKSFRGRHPARWLQGLLAQISGAWEQ
jgi:hypothetical protein